MTELLVFAVVPAGSIDCAALADTDGLPPGLRAITVGALAAVVGAAPEGGLKGRERGALLPWLLASQRVMERLLARAPVLPVALGTVLEDEERVHHMLNHGAGVLQAAFDTLGGRFEMDLSVRWTPEAAQARRLAGGAPPSRAAAEGDAALRDDPLTAERQEVRRRVVERLRTAARDLVVTEPTEAEGIVSLALLVDRGADGVVVEALEALDAEFGGELMFRLVGPMPPYSFASVQVHLTAAAAVRDARAELGVAPDAGPEAVKTAYRRALRRVHPDLVHQEATAIEAAEGDDADGFLALSAAYRILQAEEMPVSLRRQQEPQSA
ncbi:GvpL/GvpF family gas vesicle protein [Xanthobacter agilis]|uniref:DnaJ-domain-containing protein 1 n=1 Tax=Xanthobacter agilis TaxID=47492 RepID=A0ABU0LJ33_XANAG|nr:GvpL/GvpF family gas vesicle protein [Xanthobacter agilis]MDQ0507107.1 DnaJ-domain-containing protein 1 [Xanthobacter agilis]